MNTDTTTTPCDAVLFGAGFATGLTHANRLHSAFDKLEPLLGGQPHVRGVGGGRYLATRSPHDTLLYPDGHERARQPRYAWTDGPDGVRYGCLIDEGATP